jgi:hypothetical protein
MHVIMLIEQLHDPSKQDLHILGRQRAFGGPNKAGLLATGICRRTQPCEDHLVKETKDVVLQKIDPKGFVACPKQVFETFQWVIQLLGRREVYFLVLQLFETVE